jgi:hypothetical protein
MIGDGGGEYARDDGYRLFETSGEQYRQQHGLVADFRNRDEQGSGEEDFHNNIQVRQFFDAMPPAIPPDRYGLPMPLVSP